VFAKKKSVKKKMPNKPSSPDQHLSILPIESLADIQLVTSTTFEGKNQHHRKNSTATSSQGFGGDGGESQQQQNDEDQNTRGKHRLTLLQQQRQADALSFLNTLPDEHNPVANDFLRDLQKMEMPTQAFSKLKPTNAAARLSSALPVCHYPQTRDAILALLGPETDSGTFPQSLLSAPLTTRLGVTVSTNVPEQFLSMERTKSHIDHSSFRLHVLEKGGLANKFNSMRVREVQQRYNISASKKSKNRTSNINQHRSEEDSKMDFLDLDKDFVPSEDDENDYVAVG
jgi:hypothetical protein